MKTDNQNMVEVRYIETATGRELITEKEHAKRLGVKDNTLRQRRKRGMMKGEYIIAPTENPKKKRIYYYVENVTH